MGVLEILSAAIETVCGLEVAWLHIMVDRLHVDHLLGVQVDVRGLKGCLGLGLVLRSVPWIRKPAHTIGTYPLKFLGQHRQVELCGIIPCQITVSQPIHDFGRNLDEFLLLCDILILDPVHLTGLGIDRMLFAESVVPRTDPPGLHIMVSVREHLDKTQFDNAVIDNIKPRALNVKEKQRPFKRKFHSFDSPKVKP